MATRKASRPAEPVEAPKTPAGKAGGSQKIVIYQMLNRIYGNKKRAWVPNGTLRENGVGKMNNLTPSVLKQLRQLGISHLWFTGIVRHATQTDYTRYDIPRQHPAVVKGKAGSPYAIVDYYDVDPDLAVNVPNRMKEFEQLVGRTHKAGMKVIIDFVPNHVARQYHSIAKPEGVRDLGEDDLTDVGFDPVHNNFYYCPGQSFAPHFDLYRGEHEAYTEFPAKATGNDHFDNAPSRNDWYETVKLNYGVDYYAGGKGHFKPMPDTWKKMLHILQYWIQKGVDGFRCDMAEMVPVEFWTWVIKQVRLEHPDVLFVGEVYNPTLYRQYIAAGFDYLYDKVGMYDTVCDVLRHRRDTSAITQAWQQTDDIRQHMLYFLENHDELRLASDFMLGRGRKALPALITCALMERNPFMLYFAQEWGERGMDEEGYSGRDGRTTIFDYWALNDDTRDYELWATYSNVLNIATKERAATEGQMFDLMYVNQRYTRQYAFLRSTGTDVLLVVTNFDDEPATIDLRIPAHAFDHLGMPERSGSLIDLLYSGRLQVEWRRDTMIEITLPARGSHVYKLK